MAKVKNQDIPTDIFEEELDPPLEFKDQYRRVLSEGIDHPRLEAGEELVTYSKKDSRPAQRSSWKYFKKPKALSNREMWRKCSECWHAQYFFEAGVNDCHSAGSKKYWEDWNWVPGAKNTYYNTFMSECMAYLVANPGKEYPKCQDITLYASEYWYCPNDEITVEQQNGVYPLTIWADCGTTGPGLKWTAPADYGPCPDPTKIYLLDSEGRKGCAEIQKKPWEECCCAINTTLGILYTTLAMQCAEQQTFQVDPANPGCPPYTWELEGGGELSQTTGSSTTYWAPSSNPNCVDNPTITLRDACGKETQLKLAVNCYTEAIEAYRTYITKVGDVLTSWCFNYPPGCPVVTIRQCFIYFNKYLCNGNFISENYVNPWYYCAPYGTEPITCCEGHLSYNAGETCCCTQGNAACPGTLCNCRKIGTAPVAPYCGQTEDTRTTLQKELGCCPINPETGLPF